MTVGKKNRVAWGCTSQLPGRRALLLECMWEMREKQKVRIYDLDKTEWISVPFPFLIEKTVGEILEFWDGSRNHEFCLAKLSFTKYYDFK